jgi:CRISPR/Cas system-associated endonuclease/helicase Cas3
MAKSYWLINANRKEVKRFIKNNKSIAGVFEYMFVDTGQVVDLLGKETLIITNTISVDIDLAREIYERLLSQGWRKTEDFSL